MARIKAAIKDIKKSRKNRARNLAVKHNVKKAIRAALEAIKNNKEVTEKVKAAVSVIDKAVENGILHRNTAARRKSKLMLKLKKASKK
ncbi:30S ribosomal protein S20 [Candidatus Margulisiibacteriota bacterium]